MANGPFVQITCGAFVGLGTFDHLRACTLLLQQLHKFTAGGVSKVPVKARDGALHILGSNST